MRLWWLSFCDETRPEGSRFLGACMVHADGLVGAVQEAHRLGINPVGDVQAVEAEPERAAMVPASYVGRLMDRAECEAFDAEMLGKAAA